MSADEVAKDIRRSNQSPPGFRPGLLESAYQACLAHELRRGERRVECEVALGLQFEGMLIEVGYRIDMRIDQLVLENKNGGKNFSHPRCPAVDLPQTERLVFGIDYQLERDLAPRRHPASGPKPS